MVTKTVDPNSVAETSIADRNHIDEFTSVITRRLPVFHRIAYRRLGNLADAEDAVQDALLSAYKHLDQFKGRAKFSTWLTAIVMNSAGSKLRRHIRYVNVPVDGEDHAAVCNALLDNRPNPEEVCQRLEMANRVLRLTKSLSPKLRRVVELHYLHGLSTQEMANTLGLSNSAAKARLSRARGRLRRLAQGLTGRRERISE